MLGRRFATGLTSRSAVAAPVFTPASLFAAGEQGVWYDPSDLTTMFTDSAGTTPVGTPGNGSAQPVGLLLDKSQNAVGTNGAYSYNKVNYSEDFTNAWWFLFNSTITATNITSPTGTSNASTVNFPSTGSLIRSSSTIQWSSGASGTWQIWAKKSVTGGADYIRLSTNNSSAWATGLSTRFALTTSWQLLTVTGVLETGTNNLNIFIGTYDVNGNNDSTCGGNVDIWGAQVTVSGAPSAYQKITSSWAATMAGNHATQSTASARPELSARYNILVGTATLSTQSVTTVAATYTLSFSGTGTITLTGTKTGVYNAGTNTLTGVTAGTLILTVAGTVTNADLRVSNDGVGLPAYQRVVDANTYDSTDFPYYIKADGVDDGEVTSSIDFSGTNKVTVFAGLRKLSDSALASVAELSATIASNNGSFLLSAPNSAAANYNFSSKGTTQVDNTVTTYTSPITSIVTGIGDISAPNNQIRVNSSLVGTQTGSQGTGNYGNYALYLFRRGGSSAPFNGRTYGMIVRGASSTATEITNTETWLNGKTKAY